MTISLLLGILGSSAQDVHFSQFDGAPLHYNPAFAGQFDGDYRFTGIQRTQWRSITQPYTSFGLSADGKGFLNFTPNFGAGLSILQDRAGDSRLNTLQFNIAGAYSLPVGADSSGHFTIGIQTGFTQRKFDDEDLRYGNQWNGYVYDPNVNPNENYSTMAFTNLNLNLGVAYFRKGQGRNQQTAGFSIYQWNTPKESFFDNDAIRLDPRINFQWNGIFELQEDWDLMPAALLSSQGKYKEFILGSSIRHILLEERGLFRTIYGGLFFRTRDAGYLVAGMDYDQWRVGLSYDINISDLKTASNKRGGLEVSVVYILKTIKMPVIHKFLCPDYL